MQLKPYRTVISVIVLLSLSLFFVLDVVPWMWSSTWTKFKYCGHEQNMVLADTVCILFVAVEPRAPGVSSSDMSSVNPLSRRFMANMFRAAHSFVTPDLIVFIGDFFDEEAWRSRQTDKEDWSESESSFLADFFVLPQDSQVVIVPGEVPASPSASQRAAAAMSPAAVSSRRLIMVDHPTKTKFLDVMVWPGDRQLEQLAPSSTAEADAKLKRLKAYAADPPGSVQMLLSFRSPGTKRTGLVSHLSSLKPHLLISQGDGQASLRVCELASRDACRDQSRDFAAGHMLQQGLRSNRSLFVDLQLPTIVTSAVCCFSKGSTKVGFAAAHIDMFGDMSTQVLWSPTPITIIFTYLLTAATSAFIVYRWAHIRTSAAAFLRMPALLYKRQAFMRLRQ